MALIFLVVPNNNSCNTLKNIKKKKSGVLEDFTWTSTCWKVFCCDIGDECGSKRNL